MSVNLSVKGVPDEIAERLRQRAASNHRSLQGELMALLEAAAAEPAPVAVRVIARGAAFRQSGKTIEQIAAEHLARYPEPIDDGLRSVDIIRADRDSR
jgi:plasmid stability protein